MHARLLVPDHFDLVAAAVDRCVALAKHLAAVAVAAAATVVAVVAAVNAGDAAAAAVVVAAEQPLEPKRGFVAAAVAVGLLAEAAGFGHVAASPSAVGKSCSYSSTSPSAASLAPAELGLGLELGPLEPELAAVESGLAPVPVLERERELVLGHGHVPPELEPEQLEPPGLEAGPDFGDDPADQTVVVHTPNQPENIRSASDPEQPTVPPDTLGSTDPLLR